MIMLRDSVIQDIIQFLEHCEGKMGIPHLFKHFIYKHLYVFCEH